MVLEVSVVTATGEPMETMEEATLRWTGGATKYTFAKLAEQKPHVIIARL